MRFIHRTGSVDLNSTRVREEQDNLTPRPLATPSSLRYRNTSSTSDFSPSPTPSSSHAHHSRSASLASKFSRAFSLNRRDAGSTSSNITAADISAPVVTPAPPTIERWDNDFVFPPVNRSPRALDQGRSTGMMISMIPVVPVIPLIPVELVSERQQRIALPSLLNVHRRHGIVFHCDEPPSPSPPTRTPERWSTNSPRHLRYLSMPTTQELSDSPLSHGTRPLPAPPRRQERRPTLPLPPLSTSSHSRAPHSPLSAVSSYDEITPSSPTQTATTGSLHSTASSRFRIKRKPVPTWTDNHPASPSKTPKSSRWSLDMSTELSPSLKDLDHLFDELFNECRTEATRVGTTSRPTSHHRSNSTPVTKTLQRTHAVRQPSRRALVPSKTLQPTPTKPPTSPTKKYAPVPPLNPFFPSGRSFDLIRSKKATATETPTATPKGRVKTRVRELERMTGTPKDSPTSTPVKHLGSILERTGRVDSNELTLESKRMMEEARRRRSRTIR